MVEITHKHQYHHNYQMKCIFIIRICSTDYFGDEVWLPNTSVQDPLLPSKFSLQLQQRYLLSALFEILNFTDKRFAVFNDQLLGVIPHKFDFRTGNNFFLITLILLAKVRSRADCENISAVCQLSANE